MILLGALFMSKFTFGGMNMMGMMGYISGGMGVGMMGSMMGFAYVLAVVGLVSGVLVVVGSVMMYTRPSQSQLWAAVVLGFSVVSILGGFGGFVVGPVLGVVGGVLGLTWRPGQAQGVSLVSS